MKLTQMGFFLGLLVGIAACLSVFSSSLQETDLAMVFYFAAAFLSIILGKMLIGNYSNFTVIFLVFSALYSLSGPIAARYGGGIIEIYPTPYMVDEFLIHYSLAILGLAIGIILASCISYHRIGSANISPIWNHGTLFLLAYAFAAMASLMEIANFLRAGGFVTLYAGKAVYQDAVSELPMNFPSATIMLLSTALLSLSLSAQSMPIKNRLERFSLWLALGLPIILSLIILGERTTLLSIIIILLIGYLFLNPVKTIELKWIVFIFLIYLAMAFLYGTRSYLGEVLSTGNLSMLFAVIMEPTFWPRILNPASNDFCCVFGNFNTYILSGTSDIRLGETYMRDIADTIPRFVWPDKPQTTWVDFRDTFFPEYAQLGVTGGTGYSSVLEAYVNFGTIGVLIVYLLLGLVMGCLEIARQRSKSLMFSLFYLLMLPVAMLFHRTSMGNPIFWPLLLAFVGSCSYILINSIYKSKLPINAEDQ